MRNNSNEEYPRAGAAHQRMICIDRLIHAFHWDLRLNLPNRSAANNLIEGSHDQVLELLDRLSYGEVSPAKDEWRRTVETMRRRRRGDSVLVSDRGQ